MSEDVEPKIFKTILAVPLSKADIFLFLKSAYQIILIFGVFGIAFALAYLKFAPKKYEAVTQMQMAQLAAIGNVMSFTGVNVEDASRLISRLSMPVALTPHVQVNCGLGDGPVRRVLISNLVKITTIKGVPNVVELKAFGESPQAAENCVNAFFEMIKASQMEISKDYIKVLQDRRAFAKEHLQKISDAIAADSKTGTKQLLAYLLNRDEHRILLNEINALEVVINSEEGNRTRLITPVFASDIPVAPKKPVVLAVGIFGGLLLGLLLALTRRGLKKS